MPVKAEIYEMGLLTGWVLGLATGILVALVVHYAPVVQIIQ